MRGGGGGIPVKVGVLSVLFQGNVSIERFIKEGEMGPKQDGIKKL